MTSRAQVKFDANDRLVIEGRTYRVTEHPALPGIPYVQRGGRGFVIQLADVGTGERFALKYFKVKYRVANLVQSADALRKIADLPGLKAANRTVFTPVRHSLLLAQYPALEYGVLMPWLPGTRDGMTWYDIVAAKAPVSVPEAIRLAQQTARVLGGLESHGLAHCDIAGANVMVDRGAALVELVDIEEMYGAGLPAPVEAPGGQDGYQHPDGRARGQWRPEGDRFAGAILLCELLGWGSKDIRNQSADEHYFATSELTQTDSGRYKLLHIVLKEDYSAECAALLEQAWRARTLSDCPPLGAWQAALEALAVPEAATPKVGVTTGNAVANADGSGRNAAAIVNPPSAIVSGRRMIAPSPTAPSVLSSGLSSAANGRGDTLPDNTLPETHSTDDPTADANGIIEGVIENNIKASAPSVIPASKAVTSDRLKMAGVQLCRNCGAENPTGYTFCKKCGFYAGTVEGRKFAQKPSQAGKPGNTAPAGSTPQQGSTAPKQSVPPKPVQLVKPGNSDIIAATRQGDKRIVVSKPPAPEDSAPAAGIGAWIVVAVIFFIIAGVAVLALVTR